MVGSNNNSNTNHNKKNGNPFQSRLVGVTSSNSNSKSVELYLNTHDSMYVHEGNKSMLKFDEFLDVMHAFFLFHFPSDSWESEW